MTRLVTTPRFRFDTNEILNYLEDVAGPRVAAKYSRRFDEAVVRLSNFPESGAPRPSLGTHTRIAIVQPYLLIYDFIPEDDTLLLLRVLHGRRNITLALLRR
jgi:toxin ParE1/3/4